MNPRRLFFALLTLLTAALTLAAQQREAAFVTGNVTDDDSEAVTGAMVRAYRGAKIAGYCSTDTEGNFRLKVASPTADTLRLSITCLGYEPINRTIRVSAGDTLRMPPMRLTTSSKHLREVVVQAPDIRERGDTTVFRLSAFAGKSDITLEDGLKKIPGIDISASGSINYLGREIKNFYVEGLQLAGSRYNQITRNLPSQYVTDIELVENHQAARVDSGRKSEDVALNVKLNSRVKFRPVGTAELRGGIRDSKPVYGGSVTGMMFCPSFQTMLTLKADNRRQVALQEAGQGISSSASLAEGTLSGNRPPLNADRFIAPIDRLATANAIKAFNSDRRLRANAYYAYSRTGWDYNQESILFNGSEGGETFAENYDPTSSTHRAGLEIDFTDDASNHFVENILNGKFEFERRNLSPVFADGSTTRQVSKVRNWSISDMFSLTVKRGESRFSLNATGAYTITPLAALSVADGGTTDIHGLQDATSHKASARLSTAFAWDPSDCSRFGLPLAADWIHERTETDWAERSAVNRLRGNRANISLSPYYEFTSSDNRLNLTATLGVKAMLLRADNEVVPADGSRAPQARISEVFLSPSLRGKFDWTRKLSLMFSASHERAAGDMLELLTEPVMQSFRNVAMRSGNIGRTSTSSAAVSGKFHNSITLWFANLGVNASHQKRNMLNTREIGQGGATASGATTRENTSNSLGVSGSITKQLRRAGLKFTLRGSYTWSSNEIMQQREVVTFYGRTVTVNPSITASPWGWVELQLNSEWMKSFSRFLNARNDNWTWNNRCKLMFYPGSGLELSGSVDFIRKGNGLTDYPDVALFDIGASWKVGKCRITLNADNLLNKRSYHYTVYSGLDTYNYNFRLLGRSITAGIMITL